MKRRLFETSNRLAHALTLLLFVVNVILYWSLSHVHKCNLPGDRQSCEKVQSFSCSPFKRSSTVSVYINELS
jgi:hypothetical protein